MVYSQMDQTFYIVFIYNGYSLRHRWKYSVLYGTSIKIKGIFEIDFTHQKVDKIDGNNSCHWGCFHVSPF